MGMLELQHIHALIHICIHFAPTKSNANTLSLSRNTSYYTDGNLCLTHPQRVGRN